MIRPVERPVPLRQSVYEALVELERAQDLEPFSLIISANIARTFYYRGQYEKAIEQCLETLELDPNFMAAKSALALVYSRARPFDQASAIWREIMCVVGDDPEAIAFFGNFCASAGQKSRYVSSFNFALIYTELQENDQAFRWLDKAYEERSDLLSWLKVVPAFDSLRSDPRFQELLERIGLAQFVPTP